MGTNGKISLSSGNLEVDLGNLTSYSDTFNKSVTVVPLASLSEEDTVAVESGSMLNIFLKFTRVQPLSADDGSQDSTIWSNKKWYEVLTGMVNRWQSRTDGFTLVYNTIGTEDTNPYVPSFRYNGYVKSLSREYLPARNSEIVCSMEFHVGTMYVSTNRPSDAESTLEPRDRSDFYVLMSNATQTEWSLLLSGDRDINCVESYSIFGGPGIPFEYAVLKVPKKRLASMAPSLAVDNNIIAGRNKLLINAVGRSTMTVTKCKLTGSTFTITAYCDAAILRGLNLAKDYQDTAFNWIKKILCEGKYGVAFREGTSTEKGNFIYALHKNSSSNESLAFPKGTRIWHILQVCAMYLGCRLFFANDNAYLIDYRSVSLDRSVNPAPVSSHPSVNLYPQNRSDPMYGRVSGKISLGNEGIDTIQNIVQIKCLDTSEDPVQNTFTFKSEHSIDTFQEQGGDVLYMPSLLQGGKHNQAGVLARNMLDYRDEPQQSISFSLKEMEKIDGKIVWVPYFDPTSALTSITSEPDEVYINNKCELRGSPNFNYRKYQKLTLSKYERRYPEGTTEYCFGQMSAIDLSSSTSQIVGNLNNL